MLGGDLKQALHAGQRVYGTALVGYNQPGWPAIFARLGLDFVFLDNEHTPGNRETLAWACEAYAAHGIAPLLRIPEPSATLAAMALDGGAQGIIVPYVEKVPQVRALVGAVHYRPLKGHALDQVLEAQRFPSVATAAYLAEHNRDRLLIIMIESPAGVDNLESLLAVGGVDAVLIGPHDFSVAHGIPEQYDHPLFEERVKTVIATCQRHRVGIGVHVISGTLERALRWQGWGTNLICQRADTLFIANGLRSELGALRAATKGAADADAAAHPLTPDGDEPPPI